MLNAEFWIVKKNQTLSCAVKLIISTLWISSYLAWDLSLWPVHSHAGIQHSTLFWLIMPNLTTDWCFLQCGVYSILKCPKFQSYYKQYNTVTTGWFFFLVVLFCVNYGLILFKIWPWSMHNYQRKKFKVAGTDLPFLFQFTFWQCEL